MSSLSDSSRRRLRTFIHRWPRLADALAIALPVLLFHAPLLMGLRTFPDGDFNHHFLPFSLFQADSLRALRLPLWNPHTYSGHPFLADPQAAVFYPLSNALLLLTLPLRDPAMRLYMLQVEAVLHTILAGWFVALLVHSLIHVRFPDSSGRRWAGILAGLTFALSGYLTAYPPLQLAVLRTAIWLPLILWLLLRVHQATAEGNKPWAWAMGAGGALATAFLAGHPQTFLYIVYTTTAWTLLLAIDATKQQVHLSDSSRGRCGLHFVAAAVLAATIAVGLSMAQLLPSLEFTGLSVRAVSDYAFAAGGFPLRDTWQILLPGILTQYSPLYVGLPALALALIAIMATRRPQPGAREAALPLHTATWFLCGLTLFALLVSYGDNGPIFRYVYSLLPGFGTFRGQERAAFLVALGLSVLAGIGAAYLLQTPAAGAPNLSLLQRRRISMLFGALTVGGTYAAGLLMQLQGATAVSNGRFLLIAITALLVGSATALLIWIPTRAYRLPIGLGILTLASLFLANFGANFDTSSLAEQAAPPPEAIALREAVMADSGNDGNLSQTPAADAFQTLAAGAPGRVYNEFRVWEDYAMLSGLEDLWGSSPLRLSRYAQLAEGFPLDRWWSLTGVTHVLTWRRELFVPSTLLHEYPQASDTTYLHRLNNPAPRAWIVSGIRVGEDDEAWQWLADHNVPLTSTAILPPEAGIAAREPIPSTSPATVTLHRLQPEILQVQAESDGGLLVISENWMPGWRVEDATSMGNSSEETTVQTPPFTLVRANLSFLGIVVPPGAVQFTLHYAPWSVTLGLWISGITLAIVSAMITATAFAAARRRTRPHA